MIYQTFFTTINVPLPWGWNPQSILSPSLTWRNWQTDCGTVVRKESLLWFALVSLVFIITQYTRCSINSYLSSYLNIYILCRLIGKCSYLRGEINADGKQEDGKGFGHIERPISGIEGWASEKVRVQGKGAIQHRGLLHGS